mgnify:CR=1 FL=1
MKLTNKEIDDFTEEIIEILCRIQEEEVKNVLEKAFEIRSKQNYLDCDEDSDSDSDQGSDCGSDTDDNSFFETDSDLED